MKGVEPRSSESLHAAGGRISHQPARRGVRDHVAGNFNVFFRDNPEYTVVGFTAGQLPNIAGRRYPAALAGSRYPDGIPIDAESELAQLIRERRVDGVVFSYSDVSHEQVMHLASQALAAGADYLLLGPRHTMLRAQVPVVAVCAARRRGPDRRPPAVH